jgi:hypothetical protein
MEVGSTRVAVLGFQAGNELLASHLFLNVKMKDLTMLFIKNR